MAAIGQDLAFNRTFILISSSDHISPLLGATPVALISKNGQHFILPQGPINEIGNGWYNLSLTGTDTNTLGILSYHITAPGADPTDINDEVIQSLYLPQYPPPSYTPPIDTVPSITGYINWIYTIMGVDPTVLPSNSPYILLSYDMALEWVNLYLNIASPLLYTQAVYNLGGALLVTIAQDNPNLSPPDNNYWSNLRQSLGLNTFSPGLINAANDEDTSAALLVPLNLQNLTLADLQLLKSPWGRGYLAIAQSVGSMWGLTL